MTMPVRQNLLAQLRAVEEHYEHVEPTPALEKRLRARLEAAERKTVRFFVGPWLRKYARPMVIVAAACSVLVLSLNEEPSTTHYSGPALPNAAEPSVEIGEIPAEERIEPASPHPHEMPKNSPTNAPEMPAPMPLPSPIESNPVFPDLPDPETPSEHGLFDRSNHSPSRLMNSPRQTLGDRSDPWGFWSPAQALPSDSRAPSIGPSGGLGTPSRPKPSAPTGPRVSQSACATPETWKERATLDCEENGLELAELQLLEPCEGGLFRHAQHECTEPAPDGETCTTDTLGEGDICQDPGKLKDLAYQTCKAAGQELVDFSYVTDDCGWMTRNAKFTCCTFMADPPPAPPPPPPPSCKTSGVGDGVTCKDLGLLKQEATAVCNSLGLALFDIQAAGNCPDNQATKAQFMCCAK